MKYTSWRQTLLGILALLFLFFAAAAGVYIIFGQMETADKAKLYLEAAKSLFYLITVLLIGAGIAGIVKSFESNRKADKALHEFRIEFLHRLQTTFQRVKESRHRLRASGLTDRFGNLPPVVGKDRSTIYADQMAVLQEAESEIERLVVEAGHFPDSFSAHAQLNNALKKIQGYLRSLLVEHEQYWPKLRVTAEEVNSSSLSMLIDFTGERPEGNYQKNFAAAYDEALAIVRDELLPLKRAVGEHSK